VLQAACIHHGLFNEEIVQRRRSIAAALQAAADQVVPTEMDLPPIAPDLGHFRQHERRLTRQRLLAIADELEGAE
jgi:hypothetical protein